MIFQLSACLALWHQDPILSPASTQPTTNLSSSTLSTSSLRSPGEACYQGHKQIVLRKLCTTLKWGLSFPSSPLGIAARLLRASTLSPFKPGGSKGFFPSAIIYFIPIQREWKFLRMSLILKKGALTWKAFSSFRSSHWLISIVSTCECSWGLYY